jgi:hypothetical protein
MKKICLIINTISKNHDVWQPFFERLEKYFDNKILQKKYVFVDDDLGQIPKDYHVIKYNKNTLYKEQFVECIRQVEEEFCIYISEDYILYNNVDIKKILNFKTILEKNNISFIRFSRGGIYSGVYEKFKENLFYVPLHEDYFYTNQAALWKTDNLRLVHEKGPNLHIANEDWQNSFEYQATKTCREMNMKGLFCFYGERKRGLYHYDSLVFPHISTALVKGKWNISEYPNEMASLIKQYNINIVKRGWV